MIVLGFDVGQQGDPSALVGLVRSADTWSVADAQCLSLGASYSAQVAEVTRQVHHLQRRADMVLTAVDATGVGRPIAEDLLGRVPGVAVTITAGRRPSGRWPTWRVPKPILVHAAASGMRSGGLQLPPRGAAPGLRAELESMIRKPSARIEAAGSGHDDQVLALLLAYYAALVVSDPAAWARWENTRGGIVRCD